MKEEDVSSGSAYEAGNGCQYRTLFLFHVARSEGLFARDPERLDLCLSDPHNIEDVTRIPREPEQHIPPASPPGNEHQSDFEESGDSSGSSSEKEEPDAEQSEDGDDHGKQSGDDGGKLNNGANLPDTD